MKVEFKRVKKEKLKFQQFLSAFAIDFHSDLIIYRGGTSKQLLDLKGRKVISLDFYTIVNLRRLREWTIRLEKRNLFIKGCAKAALP